MPIISHLDKEGEDLSEVLGECSEVITKSPFSLSIKVEALLQVFNSVEEHSCNKHRVFIDLMNLLSDEKHLDIMESQVQRIAEISK